MLSRATFLATVVTILVASSGKLSSHSRSGPTVNRLNCTNHSTHPTPVVAQRSSPQFSFPPPGPDVFSASNGQDISLSQPSISLQPQLSPLSPPVPFNPPNVVDHLQSSHSGQPHLLSPIQAPAIQPIATQTASSSSQRQPEPANRDLQSLQPSRTFLSLTSLTSQPQSESSVQQHQPSRPSQSSAQTGNGAFSGQSQSQAAPQSQSQPSPARHQSASHKQSQQQASHQTNHQQRPTNTASHQSKAQSREDAIEAARKAEATAASLAASAGHTYQCPDMFGYFRHHKSCDKYWACENGTSTLKLCGNGLMFDDSDPKRENCAYPFSVDCGSDRTDLGKYGLVCLRASFDYHDTLELEPELLSSSLSSVRTLVSAEFGSDDFV